MSHVPTQCFFSSVGGKGGSLSAITQREKETRISRAYLQSRRKRQRLVSEQGSEGNLGMK